MSIAIFGMRKQFLTQKISDLNFQLTKLSQANMDNSAKGNALEAQSAQQAQAAPLFGQNAGMYLQALGQNKQMQQQQLKMSEDQIATMKNRIESQLKMANGELEQVQKGEENAIKQGTPKYA